MGEAMRRFFVAMCILFVAVPAAQALECQASVQDGDGHWAWRLIDGRKCWYKGEVGMDKSRLHWPIAEADSDRTQTAPVKMEKTQAVSQVQAVPPEMLQMLPIMPPQPTFEDRWRLR
jgi:hypothetical protein